jgi:hypothetical protein
MWFAALAIKTYIVISRCLYGVKTYGACDILFVGFWYVYVFVLVARSTRHIVIVCNDDCPAADAATAHYSGASHGFAHLA